MRFKKSADKREVLEMREVLICELTSLENVSVTIIMKIYKIIILVQNAN